MNLEKIICGIVVFSILCITGLIAQCSHKESICRQEAIKAGMKAEDISRACV